MNKLSIKKINWLIDSVKENWISSIEMSDSRDEWKYSRN